MAARSLKYRATLPREEAADAIVEASTRPGFDLERVLLDIAVERKHLGARLVMSDGVWKWEEDDIAEAINRIRGEPRSEDWLLIRNAVYALFDYGYDAVFLREVRCRLQGAHLNQALPETVEFRVPARL